MKQTALSGLMGGDQGVFSPTSSGSTPSIIYEGRCYQTLTKSMMQTINGSTQSWPTQVWESYDLRTGEVYWDITGVSSNIPTAIEYDNTGLPAVEGGFSNSAVSTNLISIANNRLIKYNPFTGAATVNTSIPTFTASQYYMNGYAISVQTINAATYNYRLINWTTIGSSTNFTSRIISNVTFPFNSLGQFQDISAGTCYIIREPDALDSSGISPIAAFPYVNLDVDNGTGIRYATRIVAASIVTGNLLFNTTMNDQPITADQAPYSQVCNLADHGKLVVLMRHGYFDVFDEYTGKLLFKTQTMDYPWDQDSFGAYNIQSAYGMIYREAYSGVYAFN